MFEHAMIAVDLDAQVALLDCAPDLATWGVNRVSLVHLMKVGYAQGPSHGDDARYRASLEALAAPLRTRGLQVDVVVETAGDIGEALVSRAQAAGADLLVVGNRNQNVLERLFLGSVARKVLRRALVPVLIEWIDPGDGDAGGCRLSCNNTLRNVLVASDLSSLSRPIHDVAVTLAPLAGRVDVVHVVTAEAKERFAEWPVMVKAAVAEVSARIVEAGGRGDSLVVEGNPHEAILRLVEEREVTLLVVGKGSYGGASLGSTARILSKRAGRPVLMIPNR